MKYHFRVHKDKSGLWAECLELEGCRTQANSQAALVKNMHEVLNLYLSEPADSKLIFSLPQKSLSGTNVVTVAVDPRVAFASHLRRLRLKNGLTQKQAAKQMGFKNLYSYQRLENAKTANPELATIIQIMRAFPDFSLDDLLAA